MLAGNLDSGIAAFETAVRNAPDDPVLRLDLALIYEQRAMEAGRAGDVVAEAGFQTLLMDTYRRACADFPENLDIAQAYAYSRNRSYYADTRGAYAESRAAWAHCLALMEDLYAKEATLHRSQCRVLPLLNLARLELSAQRWTSAGKFLRRAATLAPESEVIAQLYGQLPTKERVAAAS